MDENLLLYGVLSFLGYLVFDNLKNMYHTKQDEATRKKNEEFERKLASYRAQYETEDEARAKMKEDMEKELNRELTDEELTDFFNGRYPDP